MTPTQDYKICTYCVMDTSDPEITFDESGRCCHCTEFLNRRSKHNYHGVESDRQLDDLIDAVKRAGKRKPFDCVIGVSGGADSSYLAWLVKERGLRPLAVHMDNGWNSDKAVINIRLVTAALGIDYESYVLDWEEFKSVQLAFLKASVPEAETPTDVAIAAVLHKVADQYGIKYILSGGNLATEGILPKSWHYDAKDFKYFRHINRTFGTRKLKSFPTFGYKREVYYKLLRGVRMAYPLNFVPYVKDDVVRFLESKFGWRSYGGKHHESSYTKFIQSYYLYEKFGIDYRRATLTTMICNGDICREHALAQLETEPYDPVAIEEDKHYIAKKLGLSYDEFDAIIKLPPKWSWDYPNEQRKLRFIYDAYRMAYGKEKLDRF